MAENFKGNHFEFFVENLVRENSVQIQPNFPAKKLLISHICDRLIEFLLTNCKIKLYILDYLMNEIKMTKKEETLFVL